MDKTIIHWDEFHRDCDIVASQLHKIQFTHIVALSRGGVIPARIIAESLNSLPFLVLGLKLYNNESKGDVIEITQSLPDNIELDRHDKILLIDDISDTGETLQYAYSYLFRISGGASVTTACPYYKPHTKLIPTAYSKAYPNDEWVVFPFEKV